MKQQVDFIADRQTLYKTIVKCILKRRIFIKQKQYILQSPQQRVLLVLFIKAENHTLSMSQIMADVWPGKSISPDCFHKAIERLRDLLRQLPMTIQIEYLGEEIYQMQIL
jgi:DNA-binding winged helix-turn-helix (wHTH) protein